MGRDPCTTGVLTHVLRYPAETHVLHGFHPCSTWVAEFLMSRRACPRAAGVLMSGYVDVQGADTEQPIAAPAWPSYGTHPPLRNLCTLRTVRAAGSGFRGRHRALCAGRGILGRLFGLSDAARPRT